MSSYRKKSDWGCLAWFILAFAIIAAVLCVILLATSPSGGGGSPCQSLSNNDRLGKGNSTRLVKLVGSTANVTDVSFPVGTTGGGGGKPAPVKPVPVKPGPAIQPVKPTLSKPVPVSTAKPPQGGSGGLHKGPKVDIDIGDCD